MRKQLALVNTEAFPQPQNLKGSGGVCVYTHLPSTSPQYQNSTATTRKKLKPGNATRNEQK